MQVEIIMPKMGESITEGTILKWMKKVGDKIQKDETILEISTDKVDSEIPSPVNGTLIKIIAKEQDTVPVGNIIAFIETEEVIKKQVLEVTSNEMEIIGSKKEVTEIFKQEYSLQKKSLKDYDNRFYSPLVRKIIKQEKISEGELGLVVGTGFNGRVTKSDILKFLEYRNKSGFVPNGRPFKLQHLDIQELKQKYPEPKFRLVQMDNIQRKMAEHMVRSVSTSPHVTVVDEVDLSEIMNYRFRILKQFERQHGFKLTVTPFFAFAVVKSLKEYPILNSSVDGDVIIYKNNINLGIAVASPSGLIVPVIHNAGEKSFNELANTLNDVTVRAKSKKLTPDEITDGTFSITNYGVFGNIIGTPIINQPQVGILGVGSIKKRPVIVEDENNNESVVVRSMVYLTLSFDHRIIDGATGGKFLARIKWYLENFDFSEIN